MQPLDIPRILSYGAIGLGCVLAVLSYWLLLKEQKIARPRKNMLRAIYIYMTFSLILAAAGFVLEYLKSDAAQLPSLKSQLGEANKTLSEQSTALQNLSTSRELLRELMDLKAGKLARLESLDRGSPGYFELVEEIQRDLRTLDGKINAAIQSSGNAQM